MHNVYRDYGYGLVQVARARLMSAGQGMASVTDGMGLTVHVPLITTLLQELNHKYYPVNPLYPGECMS